MVSRWKFAELSQSGVKVLDCEHRTPPAVSIGFPYIAIPNIRDGRLDLASVRQISADDLREWTRRIAPQTGDIIVTRRGRVGDTAVVPPDLQCAIGQNLVLLRSASQGFDQSYLRWVTRGPLWEEEVRRLTNVGAVFESLNVRDIARIRVPVPPVADQVAIAEVLCALDDKIAVNERIVSTSLSLGSALLEQAAQQDPLNTLVGNIAELVYGKSLPEPKRLSGDTPVFGCTGQVGWHNAPLTPSRCPVVGRKGANAGHVSWMSQPGWVIDTAFYARPVVSDITVEALYFVLSSAGLKSLIGDSAVPGVNRDLALRHHVRIPGSRFMQRFCDQARELLNISVHAEIENRTLTTLRDTLLPQLVTGKIRVKDAERVVEDATS